MTDRWSWTQRGAGVDLRITEVGGADRPAIVLAHGVGSSARFVADTFAGPVRDAGLRLVAYDLRGHGRSSRVADPAGHALDRQLEDLHAVVRATGARSVGGVSLGGHVAVAYAARGGAVDGVVACLPAWTGRAVPGEGPHAAVAAQVRAAGAAALIEGFRRDTDMPAWLRSVLVRDWSAHDPASLEAALVALDGGLAPTEAELRSLGVPLGVVGWPGDDAHPLDVAAAWAGWAPRGRLVVTSLAAPDDDVEALGHAAVEALALADTVEGTGAPPAGAPPAPAPSADAVAPRSGVALGEDGLGCA